MKDEYTQLIGDHVNGIASIFVWSDGKTYDPSMESYRPVYTYKITYGGQPGYLDSAPPFEYVGNDINGGCNEPVDNRKGMRALLSFLYACQESDTENSEIFPPHVRDWAGMFSDELSVALVELEVANTLTVTPKNLSVVPDIVENDGLHHCPECGDVCGISDYSDGRCKHCVRASCPHEFNVSSLNCDLCGISVDAI